MVSMFTSVDVFDAILVRTISVDPHSDSSTIWELGQLGGRAMLRIWRIESRVLRYWSMRLSAFSKILDSSPSTYITQSLLLSFYI